MRFPRYTTVKTAPKTVAWVVLNLDRDDVRTFCSDTYGKND